MGLDERFSSAWHLTNRWLHSWSAMTHFAMPSWLSPSELVPPSRQRRASTLPAGEIRCSQPQGGCVVKNNRVIGSREHREDYWSMSMARTVCRRTGPATRRREGSPEPCHLVYLAYQYRPLDPSPNRRVAILAKSAGSPGHARPSSGNHARCSGMSVAHGPDRADGGWWRAGRGL